MKYICMGCGKELELDLKTARKVQCPYCGYRIVIKPRAGTPVQVEAL